MKCPACKSPKAYEKDCLACYGVGCEFCGIDPNKVEYYCYDCGFEWGISVEEFKNTILPQLEVERKSLRQTVDELINKNRKTI